MHTLADWEIACEQPLRLQLLTACMQFLQPAFEISGAVSTKKSLQPSPCHNSTSSGRKHSKKNKNLRIHTFTSRGISLFGLTLLLVTLHKILCTKGYAL